MKTLDDLRRFYNTALSADLNALEAKRKAIMQKLTYIGVAIAILVIITLLFVLQQVGSFFPATLFPLIGAIVLFAFIANLLSKGYVREFKNTIIQKIVH